MKKGKTVLTPLPAQIVSNEELFSIGQMAEQARVEQITGELAAKAAGRLGVTQREFSIWYGTLQWRIEAFRRFQIPDQLIEKHQYQPLTRRAKEQVFGFNSARVFGVDVEAKRREVPNDALGRLRMSYLEEGPEPSRRAYGWVVG